ncbi:MAG: TIGR03620 family F420-dependent LLM class oxidoreductase [Acidimicrobiales bacterium]|jgi:probable F420-dependent oxidoreductase
MNLGRLGIWWSGSWKAGDTPLEEVAAEVEYLGYQTLWASAGWAPGIPAIFKQLIDATEHATVATGILSVWPNSPAQVGEEAGELGERFLLGVGVSHSVMVEKYERPLHRMAEWLEELDSSEHPVADDRRILAALGPRMLRLAAERSLGAHPYLVPLEHTNEAREILGIGPVLATEVAVVLETDPDTARAAARSYTSTYLTLPNYVNNLLSLGWTADDMLNGGSDDLVDALIPWGTPDTVVGRIWEHLDAGADHVCVQVIRAEGYLREFPLHEYRELAAALP